MAKVEMVIDGIRVSLMNYQRVVILKEKEGERYLPCWIGPAEADAIAIKMQGVSVPRPLTHDFVCGIISTLGATVNHVIISELKNDTFYAKVVLNVDDEQTEIDCRPSDALAVAIRVGSPIFADEKVLKKAGILLDAETGRPIEPSSEIATPTGSETEKKPSTLEVFSESAQNVFGMAENEAKRLNHDFVSTGHLLLALVKEVNTASEILKNLGTNLTGIPAEIQALIRKRPSIEVGEAGLTSAVKRTIELSIEEAKRLGSRKVQPEHILIGLLRQNDGIAADFLKSLRINPERIYIELIRLYTRPWHQQPSPST
jgi:bifunctional DNase/RNase